MGEAPGLVGEERLHAALALLEEVARRLHRRLGGAVALDDLISIGHFAVADLIRRYDPDRAPFEPYLRRRLKWAMLDGVRKETHGRVGALRASALRSSDHLAEARAEGGAARDGMPPSEPGHRARLRRMLREHALVMGIKLLAVDGAETAVTASSTDPARLAERRAVIAALREAIEGLDDPRQRALLDRHYFEGESLTAIADDWGITKSWASRIHAAAVSKLQMRLRGIVSSR